MSILPGLDDGNYWLALDDTRCQSSFECFEYQNGERQNSHMYVDYGECTPNVNCECKVLCKKISSK